MREIKEWVLESETRRSVADALYSIQRIKNRPRSNELPELWEILDSSPQNKDYQWPKTLTQSIRLMHRLIQRNYLSYETVRLRNVKTDEVIPAWVVIET